MIAAQLPGCLRNLGKPKRDVTDMPGCRADDSEAVFCAPSCLPGMFAVYDSVLVSLLCMYNYPALNSQSDMSGH